MLANAPVLPISFYFIYIGWLGGRFLRYVKMLPGRMELDMNRVSLEVSRTALVCGVGYRYFIDNP